MEKKKYSKPVVVAERFEPQEFCVTCWLVEERWVLRSPLYQDTNGNGTLNWFTNGEGDVITYRNNTTRIPESGSIKDGSLPNLMPYNYYDDVHGLLRNELRENDKVSPVYSYRYNG